METEEVKNELQILNDKLTTQLSKAQETIQKLQSEAAKVPEETEIKIKQARKADQDLIAFIEKERDENIQKLSDKINSLKSEKMELEKELGEKNRIISDFEVRIFDLENTLNAKLDFISKLSEKEPVE